MALHQFCTEEPKVSKKVLKKTLPPGEQLARQFEQEQIVLERSARLNLDP